MYPSFDDVMKWTAMRNELGPSMTHEHREAWLVLATSVEELCEEGDACPKCKLWNSRGHGAGECYILTITHELLRCWSYKKAGELAEHVLKAMSDEPGEGFASQP